MHNLTFTPVMSNGLGVESTAILLRWLLEPETRDFPLEHLIVITAMVGTEWPDTATDFESHILPLLREHGVRFVQVARGGHLEEDGIVILDDSRSPECLHIGGAYRLEEELEAAGTVPQYGSEHRCSLKFKAFVIESWLDEFVSGAVRHTFGFNSEERDRVEKSDAAIAARARVTFGFNSDELDRVTKGMGYDSPVRISHYPLVLWGWNRQRCLSYIKEKLGVIWCKSACPFCPFARITADLIARQKQFPETTARGMFTERLSLAMNQHGQIYKSAPLYQIVTDSGNKAALASFERLMTQGEWGVYRVRRIYNPKPIYEKTGNTKRLIGHDPARKGTAQRCVEKLVVRPSAEEAITVLRVMALQHSAEVYEKHGLCYAHVSRCLDTYPTSEEFFVAAPARVETKARYGVGNFDEKWSGMADLYCGHSDLPLFASLTDSQ